jgi:predicted PurR-regulated permease PerM
MAEDSIRGRWEAGTLIATLAVIALLYFGRAVLLPLAMAILLAFLLDPAATRLRRWGLPRVAAVLTVIMATVAVLGATSMLVGGQLVQLAKDLPTYQTTIQQKIRSLGRLTTRPSVVDEASRVIEAVGEEIEGARRELEPKRAARSPAPQRVVVEPAQRDPLQSLKDFVAPLLTPIGTAGIVLLFVVFLMLEKNDLRDRLLRLAGANLHRSTDALSEVGDRVSRYLRMQLLVNLSYGVPMALGLWLIGVPGALLWGMLSALLRYVPYVGPVVAAAFPLMLAVAVDPGWQMLAWTLALVVTLELVSNNIVEPWLYGASSGLSPFSVIVSAVFWTALWGPVGLILATPLTVFLTVLGRHLPQLSWLDVLLGNTPAFDPPTRLYQRLLAGDVEEAIEVAADEIAKTSPAAFYNDTGVPALRLAALEHGRLSRVEHRHRVATGMEALLRNLREDHPAPEGEHAPASVLCVGARSELDTLAAEMLGHALSCDGVPTRVLPASAVNAERIQTLPLDGVRVLCLSSFGATPEAQLRFVARRLRRRLPGLQIVAALWNAPAALLSVEAGAELGVDAVAHTLSEAMQRMRAGLGDLEDSRSSVDLLGPRATSAPHDDARQALALQESGLLDPDPTLRVALDRAAQHAADVFAMPMAMVSLIDAKHRICQGFAGLDEHGQTVERVVPRDDTLCSHVVTQAATLIIDDTERDPRCATLRTVQQAGVRFYAGTPLRTRDGQVIGTLSVLDRVPRRLDDTERALLESLASDVMALLERSGDAHRAAAPAAVDSAGPSVALPADCGRVSTPPTAAPAVR